MKQNEDLWSEVQGIDIKDNIKDTLLEKYPEVYNKSLIRLLVLKLKRMIELLIK